MQPSDEDAQGNVLAEKELASIRMSDSHRTPSKEDSKKRYNRKMKIVPRCLNQIEENSINKNMKQIK
jgi:hypothetical protein